MWTPGKMRHVGRNSKDKTRLIVVYMQLPEDQYHSLVVYPDSIVSEATRTEVLLLLQSQEGQNEQDFANALHKKQLLMELHHTGLLTKLHIDDVELLPEPNKSIPLRSVINAINASKGIPSLDEKVVAAPKVAEKEETVEEDVKPIHVDSPKVRVSMQEKKAIAQTTLVQANMLLEEANKKFAEAYRLDPNLRPKTRKKRSPNKVKVIPTSGVANG